MEATCCTTRQEQTRSRLDLDIVRQGWLGKRGKLIRHWKQLYFVLRTDGSFLGYKSKPKNPHLEPTCKLLIKHCQITACDKNSKSHSYKFHIKGSRWISVLFQTFRLESELNRTLWIQALRHVNDEVTSKRNAPRAVYAVLVESRSCNDGAATTTASTDGGTSSLVSSAPQHDHFSTTNDFLHLRLIDQGSFGKVDLCRERGTGRLFAAKTISKLVFSAESDVSAYTEKQIMSMNKHPFLMELRACFESDTEMCFVMEYVNGGNLLKHIRRCTRLTQLEACFYAAQVTDGLGFLHNQGVIYRDLKPENLLIASDGYLKLTDFGLAINVGHSEGKAYAQCGSLPYMAPEVLSFDEYGRAVDWWSLGVLVYEMLTGRLPFEDVTSTAMTQRILTYPVVYPRYISALAKSFMSDLLQRTLTERLGSGTDDYIEIELHQFFATMDWTQLLEKKIIPLFVPRVTSDDDTRYFDDSSLTYVVSL